MAVSSAGSGVSGSRELSSCVIAKSNLFCCLETRCNKIYRLWREKVKRLCPRLDSDLTRRVYFPQRFFVVVASERAMARHRRCISTSDAIHPISHQSRGGGWKSFYHRVMGKTFQR